MKLRMNVCLAGSLAAMLSAGCMESLDKQVEKSPNSIVGKTTQEIGKFDPNAKNQKVQADRPNVKVTNVVTGGLEAYGPIMSQISKLGVDHAMQLFKAENDRFPKDYDEFMAEIIKKNNIQLPVLPGGAKYKYDETEHKLVVVSEEGEAK